MNKAERDGLRLQKSKPLPKIVLLSDEQFDELNDYVDTLEAAAIKAAKALTGIAECTNDIMVGSVAHNHAVWLREALDKGK